MDNYESLPDHFERIGYEAEVRPLPGKRFVLALGEMAILNKDIFYLASGQDELPDGLNHDIPYFILQPNTLDILNGRGFKAVRFNESVKLGRYYEQDRFSFSGFVSRNHAEVVAQDRQKSLLIRDLESQGGTYIGELSSPADAFDDVDNTGGFAIPKGVLIELSGDLPEPRIDGSSYASRSHPERNYDAFYTHEERGSFAVFDGVGLAPESADAARLAAAIVQERLSGYDLLQSPERAEELLYRTLLSAHEELVRRYTGVGATTAAVAQRFSTQSGEDYVAIAHAGDSRVYRYREGRLQVLTLDHSAVRSSRSDREAMQQALSTAMSLEDIVEAGAERSYSQRNVITSCLGGAELHIDTASIPTRDGDIFLVTTDGIHDNLTDSELEQLVRYTQGSSRASDIICHYARKRSLDTQSMRSKPDDMTAIVAVV